MWASEAGSETQNTVVGERVIQRAWETVLTSTRKVPPELPSQRYANIGWPGSRGAACNLTVKAMEI